MACRPASGCTLAIFHDGAQNGIILWTRGPLACRPLPISGKLIKLITDIKTGALDAEGNRQLFDPEAESRVHHTRIVTQKPARRFWGLPEQTPLEY